MATPTTSQKTKSDTEEVKQLVDSRDVNWNYIKRIHEGVTFWMNVVHITRNDLIYYYTKKLKPADIQKRSRKWFCMGISLSNLLSNVENLDSYIKKLEQFWNEFETFSKTKKEYSPDQVLLIPNLPGAFDYMQIIYSLCDVINAVYKKFLEYSSEINALHAAAIKKIDVKFRQHVMKLISKDIHTRTEEILKVSASNVEALTSCIPIAVHANKPTPKDAFVENAKFRPKSVMQKKVEENK